MYLQRINVLRSACKLVERNNKQYMDNLKELQEAQIQLSRVNTLVNKLKQLDALVVKTETEWREGVLRYLEESIDEDLAVIFPGDGYQLGLSARVLRGRIHIETVIESCASNVISGSIRDTQGCLFQQVVSFSALIAIAVRLGIDTIYVDEAFSGSSPENFIKLNTLLQRVKARGMNVVMISQSDYFDGIGANYLYISRSIDNKTSVKQVRKIE